jgi:sigma-B regulation protein RsbU (phosphoserine phosphatase)
MDMAAKIQLQLLPQQFPHINGLDIYAHSYPAEQVGGDFYDFSAYKDRPFVFAIGDVSGKGLPAALFMTMTRTVLHTTARSLPSIDPKAILTRVNEDLYEDFSEVGMFATAFAGCYDSHSARLSYANAGHSPIIYCPAGGPAILLEADAPMLGILPTSTCTNHVLPFRTNDILVAATDGLNESFNADGEMFGYERLLKTVETLAHLPSKQIGNELLKAINQFTRGYVQSDDQTFIIIKGVAA